ncbi:NUDIX domain-containing protein [Nocardioides sp. CER19]|uniref:NUDIX hydrolase n=1 Tax=Nocardioides sp. CER19 TaxID=3038538 RepID=UPI002447312D|nr:NUDIX domain-containing protein [Nocardioides sp. CER19]MDH2413226.1 NUDIX domain-containing protein [Nocardioides sp. CER19]
MTPGEPTAPLERPHYTDYDTRLAAYVVVVRDDRVLLALWNDEERRRWTLPGGGVELQETTAEGAVREAREETGYDVELTGLLGIETDVFSAEQRTRGAARDSGRPLKAVRVFYSARIVGGRLTDETGGSTDEARWFPLSEVPDLPRVSMVDTGLAFLSERE